MDPVRRASDGELCGFLEPAADGSWRAVTVFGGTLAEFHDRDAAADHVVHNGLDALAERWTLINRATGEEQVVCIQEANEQSVTLILDYYSLPGVPTMMLHTDELRSGVWHLHRERRHVE